MVAPHCGQRDRPVTNDSCRGIRCATTVAKLPKISPAGTARIAATIRSTPCLVVGRYYSQCSSAVARPRLRAARHDADAPGRIQLEAAVQGRVVVHEFECLAARAAPIDGDRDPEARLTNRHQGARKLTTQSIEH